MGGQFVCRYVCGLSCDARDNNIIQSNADKTIYDFLIDIGLNVDKRLFFI